MDEFMSESEQWELVKRWVRENAIWVVGGVALGVAGLAGWRIWQERIERLAHEASDRYEQALDAFARDDRTRGFTIVDELRRDQKSSPYSDQADLLAARIHVDGREYDKAVERLQRVMNDARDEELRQVARGRLARLQIQRGNADQALALLPTSGGGAFAARYEEIRGDALLAKGDKSAALTAYRAARASAASGAVDPGLLELKINALTPAEAPPAEPAPAASTAEPAPTGTDG
ncbi:MAG TPA: tetratricopeptide repeat protein [Steroidobacteraceae bacterium]|nr:tetratricopeptide repeat protein [Steroidobacteraceae bacterium]HNS27752.1 tetratricopeptide repeat protein [Steroidobacteraceae bacterium]